MVALFSFFFLRSGPYYISLVGSKLMRSTISPTSVSQGIEYRYTHSSRAPAIVQQLEKASWNNLLKKCPIMTILIGRTARWRYSYFSNHLCYWILRSEMKNSLRSRKLLWWVFIWARYKTAYTKGTGEELIFLSIS